jgi:carbamoyl-phosphate synthase large subunit
MSRKSILIFGAGINQLTLIKAARSLHLQTIVLDPFEDAPGKRLADHFYCVAGNDYERTREIALRHKVGGIVTSQMEKPMRLMARLAQELGLIFHSLEVTERSLDKWLMKQRFVEGGVPCARGVLIARTDTLEESRLADLAFPVIIKPKDGSSSQGVFRAESFEEIGTYRPVTQAFSRDRSVIIEEFLEGPEFSIESITSQGKTTVVQFTEKFITDFPHTVEMGHLQPAPLSLQERKSIEEAVIQAIDAIGIDFSASHTEIKLTEEGPKVIEIGARLGGDFISSYLTTASCGVDLDRAAVQVALGIPPDLARRRERYACIQYCRLPAGRRVREVGDWQEILDRPGVVFADLKVQPGDVIPEIRESKDRPGFVIVAGDSREAVLALGKKYREELAEYIRMQEPVQSPMQVQ